MIILFASYLDALDYLARQDGGMLICPVCDPIMGKCWKVRIDNG